MTYTVMSIVSFALVFLFLAIYLSKANTSSSIDLEGRELTIRQPFKVAKINLKYDLKKWSVRKIQRLWGGRVFVLSLGLTTGESKKIYFRSRKGSIRNLIAQLEELAPNGKIEEDERLVYSPVPQV
jgi:hypothetical protein